MNDPRETDRELFARLSRPHSPVASTKRPWGFATGLVGAAALGLVTFIALNNSRTAPAQPPAEQAAAPVVLQRTSSVSAPPPPPAVAAPSPPRAAPPADDFAEQRLRAPAMVVDLSRAQGEQEGDAPPMSAIEAHAAANERFAGRVANGGVDTATAGRIGDPRMLVLQGTIIPAITETGVNSDVPGYIRAVVSRDVRGFDGSTVLIPRGSKLIGQYKSGIAAGQSRAFIVWSRLVTPEGVSIDIGSPAVDELGQGGLKGETNSHFLKRFGAAILMSVLSAGLDAAVNLASPAHSAVVIGTPQQATNVAGQALQRDIDTPTTISIPPGTPVRAFVARDLDFSAIGRDG
ncbi:MAG TPA: TrbI/VirB10 family protein [Sphingomonas sp.]|nr:TrbI/VirB10 family protein [Sphingomonas sp.]